MSPHLKVSDIKYPIKALGFCPTKTPIRGSGIDSTLLEIYDTDTNTVILIFSLDHF